MPTDFKLPELGENVTAGDVVRVLVSPGDAIAKDQPVLELETDKATIEVPSSVSGTVKDVRVKQGERIKVGQVVLTVEDGGGAKASNAGPKPQPAEAAAAGGTSQKATTDQSQDTSASGSAAAATKGAEERESGRAEQPEAQKPEAQQPEAQQPEAQQPEAQKPEAQKPEAQKPEGQQPKAQQPEAQKPEAQQPEAQQPEAQKPEAQKPEAVSKPKRGEVVDISRGARTPPPPPAAEAPEGPAASAAPSVRRLARELGVDIARVNGSGPGGRISVDDVQSFVRSALALGGPAGIAASPLPDFTKWGEVERKPMSNIRRKTAEHLGHAWNVIPHVTQHDKADITAIEALRKQYAPQAEKAGGKLTLTAIALKIAGAALRRFPQFNASVDPSRNEIVYKTAVHIGVAVDTPRGLLVPVIRDVDRKGIIELSGELAAASEKARNGKLALEEMQGGSFTITNLGGIGGTSFTPIVNWPEVAILGISRGTSEPVYNGQSFEPRLMLPLSLSYDHRVIDGADGARFLRWVADAFEQPFVLAL